MRTVPFGGVQRHLGGWLPNRRDPRDDTYSARVMQTLPQIMVNSHSLRDRSPSVRDQLQWGSCVFNAWTWCMAFLYTTRGWPDPFPSRFYPYGKYRLANGIPLSEDSGADIRGAAKVLTASGTPPEEEWPYDSAHFAAIPPANVDADAEKHQIVLYARLPSVRTIKASIIQGWPCVMGFPVPENMQSAECAATGRIQFPRADEGYLGGHSMAVAAFDDNMPFDGGLIGGFGGPNSWGSLWGDAGWWWMPYAFWTQGLATDNTTLRLEEMP